MSDERQITPAQAALAARAAGLSLDRPLSEQLGEEGKGGIEEQLATLTARVESLTEALGGQGRADQPTEPQDSARAYADKLRDAQSQWFSIGEGGKDAA